MTDEDYIKQILNGNTNAFKHLVEKYKDLVFSVVYNVLQQQKDAEEIAQDSFLKAYQNLHTFRSDSKFSTWIYRIAYNNAVSKSRLKQKNNQPLNEKLSVGDYSTENNIANASITEVVEHGLKLLPEQDAAIISLYYLDELPVKEIATIVSLSESNVKVKLFRARKELYNLLENEYKNELHDLI
jgi:RNA polymerase sigma factor (sigma-70 family)